MRAAIEAEAVEHAKSIGRLKPEHVGEVPIHRWGQLPKLSSIQRAIICVGVGLPKDQFPGSRTALKDRPRGGDLLEVTSDGIRGQRLVLSIQRYVDWNDSSCRCAGRFRERPHARATGEHDRPDHQQFNTQQNPDRPAA